MLVSRKSLSHWHSQGEKVTYQSCRVHAIARARDISVPKICRNFGSTDRKSTWHWVPWGDQYQASDQFCCCCFAVLLVKCWNSVVTCIGLFIILDDYFQWIRGGSGKCGPRLSPPECLSDPLLGRHLYVKIRVSCFFCKSLSFLFTKADCSIFALSVVSCSMRKWILPGNKIPLRRKWVAEAGAGLAAPRLLRLLVRVEESGEGMDLISQSHLFLSSLASGTVGEFSF